METAKKSFQKIDPHTEVSLQEKAFLLHGSKKFPIHAKYASKYSLFFRYIDNHSLTELSKPLSLVIQRNGDSVELGPCRVLLDPNLNGYSGRIVFTKNVYDIQSLLWDKKIVDLQAAFKNLPAILERKSKIRNFFKNFTADLAYDLSAYKKIFDDLDSQYREEPKEVKTSVQRAIIDSEGRKFLKFFHETVEELNSIVVGFSQEEHQQHGYYFRKQLWNFILCCALMKRTNLKPRGYAGDSAMMKMIYLDGFQGETTFCKLMQEYTIGVPAAQSVRNRRTLIMEMLHKYSQTHCFERQGKIKILSVACGPAFEIEDILRSPDEFEKYHFTLLDQDPRALRDAAEFVSDIEKKYDTSASIDYVNISVRLMLGKSPFKNDPGKFHFIYSMGLFDYLSTPVATAIINKLYQLLAPGGELVVGNFHVSNPSKYFMEYGGDWHLIHRTERELKNLLSKSSPAEISVIFEDTGCQMFLGIKNHGNRH
jgi:extracellular factor (EF) 3-hydroxypalmitic acid methyl ester biosynthesis protein